MNDKTKARALRMLDKRDYARQELINKLVEKGETEEDAAEVTDRFVSLGIINDERYSAILVRHYAAKGYGASRIKNELYRRGIDRDLWDAALEEMPEQEDTLDRFLQTKLKGSADEKAIKRATDALVRRGFSWEEIRSALMRYKSELDD